MVSSELEFNSQCCQFYVSLRNPYWAQEAVTASVCVHYSVLLAYLSTVRLVSKNADNLCEVKVLGFLVLFLFLFS